MGGADCRGEDALHGETVPEKGTVDDCFLRAGRADNQSCGYQGWARGQGRGLPRGGELKRETAPLAGLALHGEGAVKQLHDLLADGQPQARSAILPRGGAVCLAEGFKKCSGIAAWQFAEVDADACVADLRRKGDVIGLFADDTACEGDTPAWGEFNGIGGEVDENLAYTQRVPHEGQGKRGVHVNDQAKALFIGEVIDRIHNLFEDL